MLDELAAAEVHAGAELDAVLNELKKLARYEHRLAERRNCSMTKMLSVIKSLDSLAERTQFLGGKSMG